ncbi:MAG TPA: alpha-L-arabinofuranosidase C-terminal domain-containing protein [Steroidobacteraceae bacterium]|nr:alpha-L-arabinofuranosidase C-terminal domain-containing protein [Steroidobacteraceae bacterium]
MSVPGISVSAARTATGEIAVALVNLDPHKATPVTLAIAGANARTVKGEILTATALDARNTFESPDAVKPTPFTGAALKDSKLSLSLPAKSVVVLSLK